VAGHIATPDTPTHPTQPPVSQPAPTAPHHRSPVPLCVSYRDGDRDEGGGASRDDQSEGSQATVRA
jgi:hypothetical protein